MKQLILPLILILSTPVFSQQNPEADGPEGELKSVIEEMNQKLYSGDNESYANMFMDDAIFHDGDDVMMGPNIKEMIRTWRIPATEMTIFGLTISQLNEKEYVASYAVQEQGATWVNTEVWQQTDGEWKIRYMSINAGKVENSEMQGKIPVMSWALSAVGLGLFLFAFALIVSRARKKK